MGSARTCLSNADLLEVVKEVDQPGFGISLDPGNVVYYTHRHVDGEEPVRNHSLLWRRRFGVSQLVSNSEAVCRWAGRTLSMV